MSAPLTPEQEQQVRAIAAEMIGQALRDIRPDSGQPTYSGDTAGPIISMEPQMEAELRLACLRLAMTPAADEKIDVVLNRARIYAGFVLHAKGGRDD